MINVLRAVTEQIDMMVIKNPIGVLSLSKREIHRFLSVAPQTIFPPVVSSTLYMYIFGVVIGQNINFQNLTQLDYIHFIIPGFMTMHLISSSYENTSSSLFIARWHNHIQEVLLSPLSYFEVVLGLLAGGLTRGTIVACGVYMMSVLFATPMMHSVIWLMIFIFLISSLFSCIGMMAALWAEEFGMLNVWNIYLIIPLVLLGGVFHPMKLLPEWVQHLAHFNPMTYIISAMRYSITGTGSVSVWVCAVMLTLMAATAFLITTELFRRGYKLKK